MNLSFVFRNLESTDALKDHITKKVEKFTSLVTYPMDIQVTLKVEKLDHYAEISSRAEHRQLVSHATTRDLYESIDSAVAKMETQLKKERDIRKGHKSAGLAARASSLKLAQDIEAETPHKEKKIIPSE